MGSVSKRVRAKPGAKRVSLRAAKRAGRAAGNRAPRVSAKAAGRAVDAAGRARSGFERRIMADLKARGIAYAYEPDALKIVIPVARVRCQACGEAVTRVTRYTPDFRFVRGGNWFYVEAKGKLTPHERRRLAAFWEQWCGEGGYGFAVLFQRNNWLTAGKKKRYSDWAEELGIPWAVGERIPEEWLQ